MRFENTRVFNFEGAFRGMRNPKNSHKRSDTIFLHNTLPCDFSESDTKNKIYIYNEDGENFDCISLGVNDYDLAHKLIWAGGEHRKFLRQILVSVDITAPIYWWKEFDTYKVGITANSTSTMHKLAETPITLECFETDDYNPRLQLIDPVHLNIRVAEFLDDLEQLRQMYLSTGDEQYWKELVRWLPSSFLQKRTVTMNYENLLNICKQRRSHRLNEWSGTKNSNLENFISWAKTLPCAEEFLFQK